MDTTSLTFFPDALLRKMVVAGLILNRGRKKIGRRVLENGTVIQIYTGSLKVKLGQF